MNRGYRPDYCLLGPLRFVTGTAIVVWTRKWEQGDRALIILESRYVLFLFYLSELSSFDHFTGIFLSRHLWSEMAYENLKQFNLF